MPPRKRQTEPTPEVPEVVDGQVDDEAQQPDVPIDPPERKATLGDFQAAFKAAKVEIKQHATDAVDLVGNKIDTLKDGLAATNVRIDAEVKLWEESLDGAHERIALLENRPQTAGQTLHLGRIGGGRSQPSAPDVFGKVLEVMRAVERVGKGRQADLGKGIRYMFRGIDDAMDAVGNAMREVGVILRTETIAQEFSNFEKLNRYDEMVRWSHARVHMAYVFVSPVDGSEHRLEMWGEGLDNSDKGTSKAVAMAMKYALLQGLCIPVQGLHVDQTGTGDDVENSQPVVTSPNVKVPANETDAAKAARLAFEARRAAAQEPPAAVKVPTRPPPSAPVTDVPLPDTSVADIAQQAAAEAEKAQNEAARLRVERDLAKVPEPTPVAPRDPADPWQAELPEDAATTASPPDSQEDRAAVLLAWLNEPPLTIERWNKAQDSARSAKLLEVVPTGSELELRRTLMALVRTIPPETT